MIGGIGTDMVEIDRLAGIIERKGDRFLQRVFTGSELDYCMGRSNPYPCLAARFAAKEAVLKALGTGLQGCRWTDVEVARKDSSAPEIILSGGAGRRAKDEGIEKVLISISHDRGRAIAFALAVKGGL